MQPVRGRTRGAEPLRNQIELKRIAITQHNHRLLALGEHADEPRKYACGFLFGEFRENSGPGIGDPLYAAWRGRCDVGWLKHSSTRAFP